VKAAVDGILQPEQGSYLQAILPPRDALLARMEALAAEQGEPISDPEVAAFLAVTARSTNARFIVELGTNIGYGAIVLARAAGPLAKVLTIELSHNLCEVARDFIAEAGLSDRIEVRQGAAIQELEKVTQPIDLAYVDCVKEEYSKYLDLIVPRLSPSGVIVADNVLWRGHVAHEPAKDERTAALRAFNLALMERPELIAVVLPLGDGVAFATRK
jgi:caffeoyl-CoA O-methyltransferase